MFILAGRPLGIAVAATLIALNGLASLYEAFRRLQIGDPTLTVVEAAIGLLLVHRAYAIWNLHRGAYPITVTILGARAAIAAFELYRNPTEAAGLSLLVVVAALLYLLRANVRRLYSGLPPEH